jgi:hypothetical protein
VDLNVPQLAVADLQAAVYVTVEGRASATDGNMIW